MRIVWSPLAIERIREAADFIARDKPGVAYRWVQGVVQAIESLQKMPGRGRVVPELGKPEIREIFFGSYRIVYPFAGNEVYILTVRHGKRILDPSETTET